MKKNNFGALQLLFLFVFAFVLNMQNFEIVQAVSCNRSGAVCPSGQEFRCPTPLPPPRGPGGTLYPCCNNVLIAGCSRFQGEAGTGRNCNANLGRCVNRNSKARKTDNGAAAGTDADGASEVDRDDDNDGADDN